MVTVLAFHQYGLGSISGPRIISALSLLNPCSALRGLSPGTHPVFLSPQEPTFDLIVVDLI